MAHIYWVGKYNAQQKQELNKSASLSFIPIKVTAEKVKKHNLDIIYTNGVRINFTSSLDTCGILTLKKLASCLD
jgi:hypothetical protein